MVGARAKKGNKWGNVLHDKTFISFLSFCSRFPSNGRLPRLWIMANIHHFAMSGLLVYCVGKFSPKEGLLTKVFYLFFGCICIIVLRHVLLCNISSGMTNTKAREMLDSGYRMPAPEGTPDEMYNLMLKCWNYEAESRPHFEEIHGKIEVQFSR